MNAMYCAASRSPHESPSICFEGHAMRLMTVALLLASGPLAAADFGDPMPADAKPVPIAAAVAAAPALAQGPHVFSGRIGKVCQKKGCWMTLTEGDAVVRVMTGYRYFFPTDAQGDAVVYGTLTAKSMDAKTTAHMAEDAGEPAKALAEASVEWQIDALAVRIE